MCEPIESVVYAGGGSTVPSECFVPAAPATHFQSPNALFHAPNGTLYVSDHGTRSIFAVETGRTYLISKPPSMGGESQGDSENDSALESPTSSPLANDKTQARFHFQASSPPQRNVPSLAAPQNGEFHVQNPYGLVGLADGSLLVADMRDNTIKRIKNEKVSVFAGSGERGGADGKFDFASFDKPKALCVTPRGDLLVSEVGSHRIRLLIMDYGGIVITVAGQGPKGYREGSAEKALFSHPSGICCSKVDEILSLLTYRPSDAVLEGDTTSTNTARDQNAKSEELREIRVHQQQQAATTALQQQAMATAESVRSVNAESNFDDLIIFVSDTMNHRVRAIYDGFVFSLAGNGEKGMADGPGNLAQFNHPAQICMAHHAILVADTRNDRVRFLDLVTNLVSTVPAMKTTIPSTMPSAVASEAVIAEKGESAMGETFSLHRPNAIHLNAEGELFVSAQLENAAVVLCCTRFVPPQAEPTKSFEATHMYMRPEQDILAEAVSEMRSEVEEDPTTKERRDSVTAQVAEDVQEQMQLLQDVKRASMATPGGHIQKLVERERSRSVDAGIFAFVSEGSHEMSKGLALPKIEEEVEETSTLSRWSPWNLWNRLTRMLSADEGVLIPLPRDDSGLHLHGGREERDYEMAAREGERSKRFVKDSSSLSAEIRDLRVDELPEVGGTDFKRLGTKRRANKRGQGKDSIDELAQQPVQ